MSREGGRAGAGVLPCHDWVFSLVGEMGGYRRQRQGYKGPHSLAADARHFIAADLSAPLESQALFPVSQ